MNIQIVPKEVNDADWVETVALVIEAHLPRELTNQLLERLCSIYQRPRMFVSKDTPGLTDILERVAKTR